jgi:hypothetical protein
METIIYTDNRRQSTEYESDRTYHLYYIRVLTDKIDVNHILATELALNHVKNVCLWFVKDNVSNLSSWN